MKLQSQIPMFTDSGALFSDDRSCRWYLCRTWDEEKPKVMFIGLNPSTANESDDDPTINRVCKIAEHNGFGGVYMMNLWPGVATKPENLVITHFCTSLNDTWLRNISQICSTVVFAWGSFKLIQKTGRDKDVIRMFPGAKALYINKGGTPKHPLYCRKDSKLIDFPGI